MDDESDDDDDDRDELTSEWGSESKRNKPSKFYNKKISPVLTKIML